MTWQSIQWRWWHSWINPPFLCFWDLFPFSPVIFPALFLEHLSHLLHKDCWINQCIAAFVTSTSSLVFGNTRLANSEPNFVCLEMAPKALCSFCTCKYCGRSNKDTENPWLPEELREGSDKPMLQFRRERGKECCSCTSLLRTKKRSYYGDNQLDTTLKSDPTKKNEFLSDLEEHEHRKREEALARASRGPDKKVEASHTTGFKMRMVMGYFWPVDVLKREGKPLPKTLSTIKYNGKNLRGAILDPSHGTPIGVIEMESYDDKGASKVACSVLGGKSIIVYLVIFIISYHCII